MNNVKNTDKKEMIAISSFFYYPMKRCTIGVTINRYKNRKKTLFQKIINLST